jgi:hypothetical protein
MNTNQIAVNAAPRNRSGNLALGTGLAFASLILVPALAASFGVGPSVTGALRIALMKASNRALGGGTDNGSDASTTNFACH